MSKVVIPVEKVTHNGIEYIQMMSNSFHIFFNELMKGKGEYKELLHTINQQYSRTQRIKRKRIRIKREKECLLVMWDVLEKCFLK